MDDIDAVDVDEETVLRHSQSFHDIFNGGVQQLDSGEAEETCQSGGAGGCAGCIGCERGVESGRVILTNAALVFRLLYDLAIDCYDRAPVLPSCTTRSTPSLLQTNEVSHPIIQLFNRNSSLIDE